MTTPKVTLLSSGSAHPALPKYTPAELAERCAQKVTR